MVFEKYKDGLTVNQKVILGIQHTFTMFGATVLVPILTGLDVSVALFMAGAGTIIFHLATKGMVPVFLGSSFAFIGPVAAIGSMYGLETACGGMVIAGLFYLIVAVLIAMFGSEKVLSFFPPIVTGPVIIIIGLTLAPVAIANASSNWLLAVISFLIVVGVSIFTAGFISVLPILFGVFGGYIAGAVMGLVDFTAVYSAAWIGFPKFIIAKFDMAAVITIAPVAVATIIEHIGDVAAVSATAGKNFIKSPGLHKTLIGDGLATSVSAMFGGPANTTYSENTGVLALTKQYNPVVMRIAALFAIVLSIVPKLGAIISTIPISVIGGISIVLFGMISAIGVRSVVENNVDFKDIRNLLVVAVILVIGLGGTEIAVEVKSFNMIISPIALAAVAGVILNKIIFIPVLKKPKEK